MNSDVFEWTAERLAGSIDLTDLEARGTLRLSLQQMGLEPKTINKSQMLVVLQRVLPGTLAKIRVPQAARLCEEIGSELLAVDLASPMLTSPEDIFRRIGR